MSQGEGNRYSWKSLLGKVLGWSALFLPFLFSILFLGQFIGLSSGRAALISLLCWPFVIRLLSIRQGVLFVALSVILSIAGYLLQRPSHHRAWMPEIAELPSFEIEANTISATNLRDFNWSSATEFDERWINASYDLTQISSMDVFVVPFGESDLAAHVMLSFGFDDGRHLAVSVETRPEIGEKYSLLGGAARQLELIYLFGTERDLLGLRILHRKNRVYAFPLNTDASFAKDLLLELCSAANLLHDEPRFYATLRHNCTTTLLRHVNRLRSEPIGIYREVLFPAKLGELLHRLGYLDTDLNWPEAMTHYRVDEKVRTNHNLKSFSRALRN
ncbi:hypothetical protein VDG1235_162 [Verrucomicrobiia bacterium DG1235]|nr:hypothetical protein VDG1235_162 [Verrucomicrobiae bacterium DG1235]